MACGLPVIATTVGGTPEIINNMKNGVLAPPRNPKAISDALSKLLAEDKLGKIMGDEARETSKIGSHVEEKTLGN